MPTGYTALIHDNEDVTVKDYLRRCASGFGFAGTRDSGFDPRPPSPVSMRTYDALREAELELELFNQKSDEELREDYEQNMKRRLEDNERNMAVFEARRSRFIRIKEGLDEWNPPEELKSLKKFALDQLEVDSSAWRGAPFQFSVTTFEEWKESKIKALERTVQCLQQDVDRAEERYEENVNHWRVFVREIGIE